MLSYAKGGGNFDGFKYFMRGSMGGTSRFPAQSVNYLESHDDMCLFDRITTSHYMPSFADVSRYKIAYALVLTAHGIPMLAEGFDLLRTKYGKNNTYKDGAANALDYARGGRFPGLCNWMRRFVEFRKSDSAKALRPEHPVSDGFFKFFAGDMSTAAAVLLQEIQSNERRLWIIQGAVGMVCRSHSGARPEESLMIRLACSSRVPIAI